MTVLNLIVLRVSNLAQSLEFYAALGLSFTLEKHGTGPEHYACAMDRTVFELRDPDGNSVELVEARQ